MSLRTDQDKYSDNWNYPIDFSARKREVRQQLGQLGLGQRNFSRILEIGPGIGAETAVLMEEFKGAGIIVVDQDWRALLRAKKSGLPILCKDALDLFDNEIKVLKVDLVLALRTSPKVVKHLSRIVQSGLMVTSIIRDSDVLGFEECWREMKAIEGGIIGLKEQRGFTEFAFIKDFG